MNAAPRWIEDLPEDPFRAYADQVVAGEIIAGKRVRQACQRHLDDLAAGEASAFYFDLEEAWRAIEFFATLRHVKGRALRGQPIKLELWQCFVVGSIFGWKRKSDGLRRFQVVYIEIPRKNGKSTLAAGIALYCLFADEEGGAEVYSAATKSDQARIVWDIAKRMIMAEPQFLRHLRPLRNSIDFPATASSFKPLGRDTKGLDGLDIHCAVLDELHAHNDRYVHDVIDTGMGARDQPLFVKITTAGHDTASVCWENHQYIEDILDGLFTDEASQMTFGYIAAPDDGDDWRDEATWRKANPNFGVSVKVSDLRRQAKAAERQPANQNVFKQKRLDVWTEQAVRYMPLEIWDANDGPVDWTAMKGRECWLGMDLARVNDLSALCYLFPPVKPREPWQAWWQFFCPERDVAQRTKDHKVPYQAWVDQGLMVKTPGPVTDFEFIEQAIVDASDHVAIREICYDAHFANELVTALTKKDFVCVKIPQTVVGLNGACDEAMRLLMDDRLHHGGNPIARWCASNLVAVYNASGLKKPDKAKSREKIDAYSALINAMARAMTPEEDEYISVPEEILVA